MADLPTGIITFLFTDVAGSTPLWEQYPEEMYTAQKRHNELIAASIERHNGVLILSKGEGDSTFSVFTGASDALAALIEFQKAFYAEDWPENTPIRVRAALHTGEAEVLDGNYSSAAVNRCARIRGLARGGQSLLSRMTYTLTGARLPNGVRLRSLGMHKLKGLTEPEQVYQISIDGLPDDFPPIQSQKDAPSNLPPSFGNFIGREQAAIEIEGMLLTSSRRLITLTGTGGCGKTRLALETARNVQEQFCDGIWLAELAPLSDPAQIPMTVASLLGIAETAGRSAEAAVQAHLKHKSLLLVLDNCEHLIEGCAAFAHRLLDTCPNLKILATSREALNIRGETAWRIPSLTIPDPRNLPPVETLITYESVRLLTERIQEKKPAFFVSEENAPAVAQICSRLDGIPLALELAAARARSMPVQEIAANLDNRFRLLTGGARTAVQRQQTLQALLDWSYQLLTEEEQRFFVRASVFVGGWTLPMALPVAAEPGADSWDTADLLDRLVDKSLICAEEADEATRYSMLETLRQYGMNKLLADPEAAQIRDRHQDYFLALAEEAEPHLSGEERAGWIANLTREHDNLRSALEWSVPQIETHLRLAGALWRFWYVRGYFNEGREYLTIPAEAGEEPTPAIRAKVCFGAGTLALSQDDYAAAHSLLRESLEIYRDLGDLKGQAGASKNLAVCTQRTGGSGQARLLLEQCLAIRRSLNDLPGIADALLWLGNLACGVREYSAARTHYRESLTLFEQGGIGADIDRAFALHNLGVCEHNQGPAHFAEAQAYYAEALQIYRKHGLNAASIANLLNCMGNLLRETGRFAEANAHLNEALTLFRELGEKSGTAAALWNLAAAASYQSDYPAARQYLKESLLLYQGLKQDEGIANCLTGFAGLLAVQGQAAQGAALLGKAAALRREAAAIVEPVDLPVHERAVAAVLEHLTETACETAQAEGAGMTREQAAAFALNPGNSK